MVEEKLKSRSQAKLGNGLELKVYQLVRISAQFPLPQIRSKSLGSKIGYHVYCLRCLLSVKVITFFETFSDASKTLIGKLIS